MGLILLAVVVVVDVLFNFAIIVFEFNFALFTA